MTDTITEQAPACTHCLNRGYQQYQGTRLTFECCKCGSIYGKDELIKMKEKEAKAREKEATGEGYEVLYHNGVPIIGYANVINGVIEVYENGYGVLQYGLEPNGVKPKDLQEAVEQGMQPSDAIRQFEALKNRDMDKEMNKKEMKELEDVITGSDNIKRIANYISNAIELSVTYDNKNKEGDYRFYVEGFGLPFLIKKQPIETIGLDLLTSIQTLRKQGDVLSGANSKDFIEVTINGRKFHLVDGDHITVSGTVISISSEE